MERAQNRYPWNYRGICPAVDFFRSYDRLKNKILTRIRDHQGKVLPGDIGVESQQEPFRIGGGEADADVFRDGGAPRAQEVVLYYRVRTEIHADF